MPKDSELAVVPGVPTPETFGQMIEVAAEIDVNLIEESVTSEVEEYYEQLIEKEREEERKQSKIAGKLSNECQQSINARGKHEVKARCAALEKALKAFDIKGGKWEYISTLDVQTVGKDHDKRVYKTYSVRCDYNYQGSGDNYAASNMRLSVDLKYPADIVRKLKKQAAAQGTADTHRAAADQASAEWYKKKCKIKKDVRRLLLKTKLNATIGGTAFMGELEKMTGILKRTLCEQLSDKVLLLTKQK